MSNALDPAAAAASGVDLRRLLWVRCGAAERVPEAVKPFFSLEEKYLIPTPAKKGLHGGGFGSHPRSEVQGLSNAVADLMRRDPAADRAASSTTATAEATHSRPAQAFSVKAQAGAPNTPWSRLEQALRATDLLLQGGGFAAIILDMAGLARRSSPAFPWPRGTAIALLRSGRSPAFCCSRNTPAPKAAPSFCCA